MHAWNRILASVLLCWSGGLVWTSVARGDLKESAGAAETWSDDSAAASTDELLIDGIVVDQLGAGVDDAEVRIELPDASEADPPLVRGVTGPRGRIAISTTRPAAEELRYRIRLEGFAEQVGTIDVSDPDDPPFIDVTLLGAASISGKVTANGQPVADAKVQCDNGRRRHVARTGGDGKYSFDSVYYGPATVTVSAPDYGTRVEQLMVEDEHVPVDFKLQPERPVILTIVTDTGEPAADVIVEARTEPLQIFLSARSDERGVARLSGVDLESTGLKIRINGERYLAMRGYDEYVELTGNSDTESPPAASRPAAVECRLEIALAGRISGKAIDKVSGRPIHNVRVRAGLEPRYEMPMDWTGPGGTYELIGVEPGEVIVTFQHERYAAAFHSVDLEAGKTSTLDVSLEAGVAVGGVVVDAEDVPVDQVRVSADRWKDYQTLGLRAITDGQGRFSFPHVPAEATEIEFTFVRPGYGQPETVILATGKTDHQVKLADTALPLTSGAAPMEETRLQPGQPVPDLTMTAMDGTVYKLSELRGKYVFLDCWATWCRPCVAEIPNVKTLHEATKDRPDFVLIGISLDTDAKALKRGLDEHEITWPQVFGQKSGAGEAFEELDGVGIPYTCLIGPDGTLIAQHLRGPGMVEEVRKLLSENGTRRQDSPVSPRTTGEKQ